MAVCVGLEVVVVTPETRMPDSGHHTIELALETEEMGSKEVDKDRGVCRQCRGTSLVTWKTVRPEIQK